MPLDRGNVKKNLKQSETIYGDTKKREAKRSRTTEPTKTSGGRKERAECPDVWSRSNL